MRASAHAQQVGSIRGAVTDSDFDAPLPLVEVTLVETGEKVTATDEGNYVFPQVEPGTYTLVFSKAGYARVVKSNVVVTQGQLIEVNALMSGEFTEMEEFVVQELQIGGGSEAGLLRLRFEAPALLDSISADLMSRAGASDAASALRLVSGASIQEGKFAVIRGLPDRYVNTQMNSVRLPTADEDKRAVQLDQFPAAVIESIQVSKTFTPDQQGDASGGAVNVVLKGIPDQNIFQIKSQISYNTNVTGRRDFLTYEDGGVNKWGRDDGGRDPQLDLIGMPWEGAAGVSRDDAPTDYKWSIAAGGRHELDTGVTIGGFFSFFYERDSEFFDNGIDDSYWVTTPGAGLVPQTTQGTPDDGDFKTKLYDVTQGTESVQWGALGTLGLETEHHAVGMTYLYTRIAEDTATLAEDTRGKEYFFPGYVPNDPLAEGNSPTNRPAAPYLRTETLEYTERTTSTLQFHGRHTLAMDDFHVGNRFSFQSPELDWTVAQSEATLYQPDKRQFGSLWWGPSFNPGIPPFIPPFSLPASHRPFKPDATFTLGNFQRLFKNISEESDQLFANVKFPFTQWSEDPGYLKFGVFGDKIVRKYDQDTFSNFGEIGSQYLADFDQFWSEAFASDVPPHLISDGPPFVDVDYRGEQEIYAAYGMIDLPINSWLNVIGGARFESTELGIVNFPEVDATWFPEGAVVPVRLNPGDADVRFEQSDVLPSIGVKMKLHEHLTLRANYSQTIARQTFKELSPILQQEYLGADIFIGNPDLRMSALENYDLRLDYNPYQGGLVSVSWFRKRVVDPIEYVQRIAAFNFTTPVNYPEGELSGWEFEIRQHLGHFNEYLAGLSVGANATFIDSEVILPDDEAAQFDLPNIMAPMSKRDMTFAPEHLYNFYLTYDIDVTGTQFAIFYTVTGDTLIAGAGQSVGNFIPDVYELEYGTLNLSVTQKIGKYLKLTFQAKNLTDPTIESVYRSPYIGDDATKTSYTKGIEYSIGLAAEITF